MRFSLKHDRIIFILLSILFFIFTCFIGIRIILSEKKDIELLKEQRKEMILLCNEYLKKRQEIESFESKRNITNIKGIMQAIDEVFQSIGLKSRLKSIKSSGSKETKEGIIEEADIIVENLNMNELINLLYRLENSPTLLVLKRTTIKKSFENPDLLNLYATLSFLRQK
jgi:hypothetical protein